MKPCILVGTGARVGALRVALWAAGLAACGGAAPPDGTPSGVDLSQGTGSGSPDMSGGASTACSLTANTSPTAKTNPAGCAVQKRDASACAAARQAAGLSGVWLKFSCRVTLSTATENGAAVIRAQSDGQPDHLSNYFPKTNACWESYTGSIQNPNQIAVNNTAVSFPKAPNTTARSMMGIGVVGLALNGVAIFGNFAAPGDDIYFEAMTFDRCGAHPENTGRYHYHGEPYSLSYDDSNLIGVMRDGYPIYGRRDRDGSLPTTDQYGGHTGVTADSAAPVYHYHLTQQTSTSPRTAGQKQWFLTTGMFRGAIGTCTGSGC